MRARVTIVMYHFVRDLEWSRYPRIKGLRLEDFRGQLAYLHRNYDIIRMEDLLSTIHAGASLPERAALLTFDDGYREHFDLVFPILDDAGVQGSFFPPAQAILEHTVLAVNKIHFILASVPDPEAVSQFVLRTIDERRDEFDLQESRYYFEALSQGHRFDSPEVTFLKRALQHGLPAPLRKKLIEQLFKQHVTENEGMFARELYMDVDQIKCLIRKGMFVGSHGYSHVWLNHLEETAAATEIDQSLGFLESLGAPRERWVMCYPYGGYDPRVVGQLRDRRCGAGLTADVGIAELAVHDPLLLPRLDTNDLPRTADSPVTPWTRTAQS